MPGLAEIAVFYQFSRLALCQGVEGCGRNRLALDLVALDHGFRAREVRQRPHGNSSSQDEAASADDKGPAAVVHAQQHRAQVGRLVRRQLQQKGRGIAAEQGPLEQPSHRNGDERAEAIEGEQSQRLQTDNPPQQRMVRDKGSDEEHVHWQTRRAAHQRRDQDGGKAGAPVFNGSGGHNARNGAGKAGQQGYEGRARKPHAGEQPIHQQCSPRHVAAVFEQGDKKEQDGDLRQEDEHAANAGDEAIDHEALQGPGGNERSGAVAAGGKERVNAIHQRPRPSVNGFEHQDVDQHKNRHAEEAVRENAVGPVRAAGL